MRRLRPTLTGSLVLAITVTGWTAPSAQARPTADTGVTLNWTTDSLEMAQGVDGTASLRLPGFETLQRPGQPEIPYTSDLIALPAGSEPTLEIVAANTHRETLSAPLEIAPAPGSVERDGNGDIIAGLYDASAPALEGTTALPAGDPTGPVVLERIGRMRGVDLARVVFYPALPVDGGLDVTTQIQARVHYNAPAGARVTLPLGDSFGDVLMDRVANPEILERLAPADPGTAPDPAQATGPTALIDVSAAGLTAITYEALAAAGFGGLGADPANLQLTRAGVAIRMQWEGDGDAAFEAGERLLFYADPRFNRYTTRDVYTLSVAGSPVARMATRSALTAVSQPGVVTASEIIEQNAVYMPLCACGLLPAGRDGDRWAWEDLRQPGRPSVTLPFTLTGVVANQTATLTVWLISYTTLAANPDHRLSLSLNGSSLGTLDWDGRQAITQTVSVPANVLVGGGNNLTLTLPGLPNVTPEGTWLDAFQVSYATSGGDTRATVVSENAERLNSVTLSTTSGGVYVYDVSTPTSPTILTGPTVNGTTVTFNNTAGGQRLHVSSGAGIRSPAAVRLPVALSGATGANYLIISHPDFLSSVASLRDWRAGRGLQVAVENAQAIYDAYDEGRPSADAIAAFIADAYAHWSPKPTYVLLVGDGTYDPKRYRANSTTTFIPPYLAVVDPWLGETAADNRYATVDGNDALPDLVVGRLPVNSAAEAQTVVNKIVAYEQSPASGFWNVQTLFAADNPDGAGDFHAASDSAIATHLSWPFRGSKAYFTSAAALTETRQTISTTVNLGVGLLVYNGHASMRQWAGERLFHMDDANQLTNGGRLPIVLSMTCFTSSYHDAGLSTLDESLIRRNGGGAVGTWGPTGLGIASGHDALSDGFLTRVYVNRQPDVGAAILAGKLELASRGQFLDLIDTFTWLGDPATRVNLATPTSIVTLPVIRR